MKFESAIFDFNGTLFFDSEYHNIAWKKLARELWNKDLTNDDLHSFIHGCPNIEAIENCIPHAYTTKEKNKISLTKEAIYRDLCDHLPEIHLVRGAETLMDDFQEKHIPFTIASASILENINYFYTKFNLGKWIKYENIIYDNGTYKNKVNMFLDALSLLGTRKETCIIFEDSLSGVQCAIEAGFTSIILLHHTSYNAHFDQYPQIIAHADNFKDIQIFLKTQMSTQDNVG